MGARDALLDNIIEIKTQLRGMFLEHYLTYELFSWNWWLEITIIIVTLLVWWKVVDKKRLLEICFLGLIVNVIATLLDISGSEYVLWEYPVHVLPQVTVMLPIDYVVVPVIDMMIYQKFPTWGKYLIVSTVTAAALAFIAEPLAAYIGQYELITWKYIYSFPIYILINIVAKLLTEWFRTKQNASTAKKDAR